MSPVRSPFDFGIAVGLTTTNTLGEFVFTAIPLGTYEIILCTDQAEIELAPIALEA